MTPEHLHLRAALDALRSSLARLNEIEDAEDDGDRGTLRAWAPSDRRGGSGGSRGLDSVMTPGARGGRLDVLRAETVVTLAWLFPAGMPATVEWMPQEQAERKARWVDDLDRKVRAALRMDADAAAMPGAECPGCARRQLRRHAASGLISCDGCNGWFQWNQSLIIETCEAEVWSWQYFNAEQVDAYWIQCTLSGTHVEHEDEHTGLRWTDDHSS